MQPNTQLEPSPSELATFCIALTEPFRGDQSFQPGNHHGIPVQRLSGNAVPLLEGMREHSYPATTLVTHQLLEPDVRPLYRFQELGTQKARLRGGHAIAFLKKKNATLVRLDYAPLYFFLESCDDEPFLMTIRPDVDGHFVHADRIGEKLRLCCPAQILAYQ